MGTVDQLSNEVNELVGLYRKLLELVREESVILDNTDFKNVGRINEKKELLLIDIKSRERQWTEVAKELSIELGISDQIPNLREIAQKLPQEKRENLMNLHSVLSLLVKRISEINRKNRVLVQSALSHINGVMESITKTFENSPTYEKKGRTKEQNSGGVGRLLAKQA